MNGYILLAGVGSRKREGGKREETSKRGNEKGLNSDVGELHQAVQAGPARQGMAVGANSSAPRDPQTGTVTAGSSQSCKIDERA